MGFFSNLGKERITCAECGDTYKGKIDNRFPYAICGHCLEKAGEKAKRNGENSLYQDIQSEFRRRGSSWS